MPHVSWWSPHWWARPAVSATNSYASSSCSTWPAPWPGRCSSCCSCSSCSRRSTHWKAGCCATAPCPNGRCEDSVSLAAQPTDEPVIRFDNVSKIFTRQDGRGEFIAVEKLSFEIGKGEIVAVLGKTGCGK